jgi:DNA-binding transcriptional MocR family regulator
MKRTQGTTIDSSFMTTQRDLFESGLVAEIGANAFVVWMALKHHADFQTGRAFPGVRRIAELVGLNKDTVSRCLHALEDAKLLRSAVRGRGKAYVARERLDVRLGDVVACHVVVDYVPAKLRQKLIGMEHALETGKGLADDAFVDVEIIPGKGFEWDPISKSLKGRVSAKALAQAADEQKGPPPEIREMLSRLKLSKK